MPAPSDKTEDDVHFLFVQTFGVGSIGPKAGDEEIMTLTADHLAGQALYFSDRPERIVGMVSTVRFLGAGGQQKDLGFTPANPPNAALVFGGTDDQPGDVAVVELIDPTYDQSSGQVTYGVRVLANVEDTDLHLDAAPLTPDQAVRHFDSASLFIDDCPDGVVWCQVGDGVFPYQGSDIGYCYDWGKVCCNPCGSVDLNYWAQQCNSTYWDQCQGNCSAYLQETWSC
jgi:hypothetical protein